MNLPSTLMKPLTKFIESKWETVLPMAIEALRKQGIKKAAVFYELESDDPTEQKILVVIEENGEVKKTYYNIEELKDLMFKQITNGK
jgi:hypothetical protein